MLAWLNSPWIVYTLKLLSVKCLWFANYPYNSWNSFLGWYFIEFNHVFQSTSSKRWANLIFVLIFLEDIADTVGYENIDD